LPLAFSFVIRPTNAVPIAVLSLLVLVEHRRYALPYFLWMLPVAAPFLLFTLTVYHSALPPYYGADKIGRVGSFLEALAGTLVTPSRGLFVYSPIFLFSIYGAWLALGRRGPRLAWALAAIVVGHWLALASFPIWWGGHSFGYRLFSDMVPYLTYFLIPVIPPPPRLAPPPRPPPPPA